MKRFYCLALIFTLLSFTSSTSFGQTSLNLGDIFFTGLSSDGTEDPFSFVLNKDITAGTEITFNENGWHPVDGMRSGERVVTWAAGEDMDKGTQITIQKSSSSNNSVAFNDGGYVNSGVLSGNSHFQFSTSGDQLFAYQGTIPTSSDQSNFISLINLSGAFKTGSESITSNTTHLPSVMTVGVNAMQFPSHADAQSLTPALCATLELTAADIYDINNWTSSNNAVTLPTCAAAFLPVEYSYFKATNTRENEVLLTWETSVEVNNKMFEIEYSTNNIEWKLIGELEGAGNSDVVQYYEYLHENALYEINYYRLKQIDYDGLFSYSSVAIVRLTDSQVSDVFVYPNPTRDRVWIESQVDLNQEVEVLDFLGRNVSSEVIILAENANRYIIDLSSLIQGSYLVKVGLETQIINKH